MITMDVIPSMGAILEADDYGMVVTALKTALELDIFEGLHTEMTTTLARSV